MPLSDPGAAQETTDSGIETHTPTDEDASAFFDQMSGEVAPHPAHRKKLSEAATDSPSPDPGPAVEADAEDDGVLPHFVHVPAEAPSGMRRCPGCSKDYPVDVVVCTECGINLVTGHKFRAEVGEVEEEDFELVEPDPWSHVLLMFFAERVPGLFNPLVLALTIILGGIGLGIIGFGLVVSLQMKAIFSGVAVCAAGMVAWGQAMAWLIFGELDLAINAMVEFDEKKWTVFIVSFLVPLPIFYLVFTLIAAGG